MHSLLNLDRNSLGMVWVTPTRAEGWLERHHTSGQFNRNIKPKNLAGLEKAMINDAYLPGVCTIILAVGADGTLRVCNGQHTLLAIVRSGKGQWMFVNDGVALGDGGEYYAVCDNHSMRSAGDMAQGFGIKEAAAAKTQMAVKLIYMEDGIEQATREEAARYAVAREADLDVSRLYAEKFKKIFSVRYIAVWHRFIVDRTQAITAVERFLDEVHEGTSVAMTATRQFREWCLQTAPLIKSQGNSKLVASILPQGVLAWNAWVNNKTYRVNKLETITRNRKLQIMPDVDKP